MRLACVVLGLTLATALAAAQPESAQLGQRLQGFQGRERVPKTTDPASLARIREGADRGSVDAQYMSGILTLYGTNGVRRDETEAYRWFSMAAAQVSNSGGIDAQWMLGRMYFDGAVGSRHGQPDFRTAARWFDMAANAHSSEGQFNAGIVHEYGLGVQQNYARAFALYTEAARQGHVQAKYYAGVMLLFGRGMNQDFRRATALIRESAQGGFAPAMLQLAKLYTHGQGVEKDYRLAEAWFGKTAQAAASTDSGLQEEAERFQKELHALLRKADERMLQDARKVVASGIADGDRITGRG
ncbi:Protein sel-1-like 2 [Hondaea fermentalgiana]|uniref:Protein sel-1-like 2 n=1 Tax=Hondaea fermentalgiana TaxID=2315210 RepID=A0A2R5G3W6_9STRA|nr:Protein sel-1-like 2 [Hondaea fermentalgiana]|eukprot:GBG24468.1 Protein sel-1-like 2 [Hondaea fermentalgiana]